MVGSHDASLSKKDVYCWEVGPRWIGDDANTKIWSNILNRLIVFSFFIVENGIAAGTFYYFHAYLKWWKQQIYCAFCFVFKWNNIFILYSWIGFYNNREVCSCVCTVCLSVYAISFELLLQHVNSTYTYTLQSHQKQIILYLSIFIVIRQTEEPEEHCTIKT